MKFTQDPEANRLLAEAIAKCRTPEEAEAVAAGGLAMMLLGEFLTETPPPRPRRRWWWLWRRSPATTPADHHRPEPDESGHARENCPAMSSADLAAGKPHPCAEQARRRTIMPDGSIVQWMPTGFDRPPEDGCWACG